MTELQALRHVGFPVPHNATELTVHAPDACGQRLWLLFRIGGGGVKWQPVTGGDIQRLEQAKQVLTTALRLAGDTRTPIW